MTVKAWGNEYRTTLVYVDSYENNVLCGRLCNPYFPEEKSVHSTIHFLTEMDQVLDAMELPQSFAVVRSFAEPPDFAAAPPAPDALPGSRATFALRILFRQNASWQGSIAWLEGKREQSFRSVLELLFLMDSALSSPQTP